MLQVKIADVFSDQSEGGPPVSIPTTDVKPLSADGTALVAAWESRSSLTVTIRQAQLGPPGPCAFFVDAPFFLLWVI
jgi:hypothetical protein